MSTLPALQKNKRKTVCGTTCDLSHIFFILLNKKNIPLPEALFIFIFCLIHFISLRCEMPLRTRTEKS